MSIWVCAEAMLRFLSVSPPADEAKPLVPGYVDADAFLESERVRVKAEAALREAQAQRDRFKNALIGIDAVTQDDHAREIALDALAVSPPADEAKR